MFPKKKDGQLGVKFMYNQLWWGMYDVLETDYDNYSIVYSKFKFLNKSKDQVWILAREPLPKDSDSRHEIYENAKKVTESQIPNFNFDDNMYEVS